MTERKERPKLANGLAAGLDRADVVGMAGALGRGLVRVSDAWLPKGKLAVPQMCPLRDCTAGPYATLPALRNHLYGSHGALESGERSYILDIARRTAVQQAMNGVARPP